MKKLLVILMCIAVTASAFTACANKKEYTVDGTTVSSTKAEKSDDSIKTGKIKNNTYTNKSVNIKIEPTDKYVVQTFGDLELSSEDPNPVIYDYFITDTERSVGVIVMLSGEYQSVSDYKKELESKAKKDTLRQKDGVTISDNEYTAFVMRTKKGKNKTVFVYEKKKALFIIEFENFNYVSANEYISNYFKTAE
ncbi:MAG: hypothetical protein IJS03_06430 [Eubacterium sp.]|nr:hypothetical protein [Eubacterium sp.]